MKHLLAVLVALSMAASAFAGDFNEKKDEPLQTTVFTPKFKGVTEGSTWKGSANWSMYPVVSQSFRKDSKSLELVVSLSTSGGPTMRQMLVGHEGGRVFSPATLIFMVDGKKFDRTISETEIKYSEGIMRSWKVILKQDAENDDLIKQIASAKEVWVTLSGGDAMALGNSDRRSAKFTAAKLEHFQKAISLYESLDPK